MIRIYVSQKRADISVYDTFLGGSLIHHCEGEYSLRLMIYTARCAAMICHYSVMNKKSRITIIRLFGGKAGYSRSEYSHILRLTSELVDLRMANANQRTCRSKCPVRSWSSTPTTKNTDTRSVFFVGGGSWIRTSEVDDNRFTVCPLWPLGNSPMLYGAGDRSRTNNLLITNQLLCH